MPSAPRQLAILSLAAVAMAALLPEATLVPAAEAAPKKPACPAGMVSVGGRFCIDAFEASLDVVDAKGRTLRRHSPYTTPAADARVVARSRRGVVPQAHISQEQAAAACESAGKRLCSDDEWLAACRGKSGGTFPYGGDHEAGRCNDKGVSPLRTLHGAAEGLEVFGIEAMNDPRLNQIAGTVAKTGQFKKCKGSAGTFDQVGNLHEWTADAGGTFRGGYYLDTEINGTGCDYVTKAHNTKYRDYSIGFRCCRGGKTVAKATGTKPKGGTARTHVVESGQTLSGIAQRYGTSVDAICEASGIDKKAPIVPGQELVVPE
ncbi:MAG: SUMF1/EgtB/PvdO family nonheme iron enzyme [Polyangiaceae bacterium]|nr:SUMF1/EgtB/PvdO family nonheme iron enzyme [Polyangiaceae bacterium]